MKGLFQKIKQILKVIPFQRIKEKFGKVAFPSWLFVLAMALLCECMVHIWVAEAFSFGRFAAVALFALGFGCILATVTSFFGWKGLDKWLAVVISLLLVTFYLVEFFVSDTYQVFMSLGSLIGGAGGVATDFGDVILVIVLRGMWRIVLMLLPIILYALFAKSVKTSWRARYFLTVGIVAAYLLGYAVVQKVGTDAPRWKDNYNFDSAVRVFGLNTALGLDYFNSNTVEEEPSFVVQAPVAPVVQEPVAEGTVPQEEAQEEVVYAPNVIDGLDFAALAEYENSRLNTRVGNIHSYVASVQPSLQNQYTGMFEGKNLIIVVAEAFAKEVIDPELTPTLYRLANEGIQFHDYYQPMWGGSTSTGEFSVLTGLVSARGTNSVMEAREQDLFLTMGNQLRRLGYTSYAYHNHQYTFYDRHLTHPYFGYDQFIGLGNGMEKGVTDQWPESDLEMMEFTVDQYIDQQPFNVYYMTVSGHCRYSQRGNKMSGKNYHVVADLDTSESIKSYIAANLELEYAMAHLVEQLEEAGIADDTVIVLSTDHYPYGLEQSTAWDNNEDHLELLYGYKYSNVLERDHSALIIWSGCIEDMDLEISAPTYSLDILPTLSNLFGLEYDSRLLVGRDVFSDTEPIILWYDHTWKTEKGYYDAATGQFTPNEGVTIEDGYVERIAALVSNKITYSREVAAVDYFNYVSKAVFPPEEK